MSGRLTYILFLAALWQNQPVPHRTVTGTVINAATGEPIRRALVQINTATTNGAPTSVLTGPDGRFQIDDVPDGPSVIVPQKLGYFDSRSVSDPQSGQDNFIVSIGPDKHDFHLTLSPAARIIGAVTNTDGEPLENAGVSVLSEQIVEGRKQWLTQGTFTADEEGKFQLSDLRPGHYIMYFAGRATPPHNLHQPWEVCQPTYYPDAADISSAQVINLQPGERFQADFHARPQPGFTITGTVIGRPPSIPELPGNLYILSENGQSVKAGVTHFNQTTGQFSFEGVPPGRLSLYFDANGAEARYRAKQEVSITQANISGLQMAAIPLANVPLNVTFPPTVNAFVNDEQASMINTALASQDSPAQLYQAQLIGGSSRWRFESVAPGKYRLRLFTNASLCAESAWYGSVDLLNDYLVISEGTSNTQPITITLQNHCPVLNVHIRAKENQKSGFILAIPRNPMRDALLMPWYSLTPTASTLAPGDYQIFSFSNIAGLEYANPDVMRSYPSHSITLKPNQHLDLTLELTDRSSEPRR